MTDAWIRAQLAQERRQARDAANAFARVCEEGDAGMLCDAANLLNECVDAWRRACGRERRRRLYGFSWTTDVAVARRFAEHWAPSGATCGGVVLQTLAAPEAIILVRQPENYYDEGEVVVDPFRLGKIKVVERLNYATPVDEKLA